MSVRYYFLFLLPVLLIAQIPDEKVAACVTRYFEWNRLAPELISADLFVHPEIGYVLKLKIKGRRTQHVADLIYGFRAGAAVANCARSNIRLLWIELDVPYKEIETTIATAEADCSIAAFINESIGYEVWWIECLSVYPSGIANARNP